MFRLSGSSRTRRPIDKAKKERAKALFCVVNFFGHKKNTPKGVFFFEKEKEKVEKRDSGYFRSLP